MSAMACPADGCGRQRRSGHLMCGTCWHQVPGQLQRRVWREWRRGRPTTDYPAAAREAIASVQP